MYLPDGVKDYLSDELMIKRKIEFKLRELFISWGYEEILPPSFEYYDTFKNTLRSIDEKDIFRFFDKEGDILALRPDVTTQIARIIAARYKDDMVKRFCYITNVFRYDEPQAGRLREFTQGGIELTGIKSDEADAEVIALAIRSLNDIGIYDFKIDVGQVEFLDGFFEDLHLKDELVEKLKLYVSMKNLSGLERYLDELDIDVSVKQLLLMLPELFGGYEVLDKARAMTSNRKALDAIENLRGIYKVLKDLEMDRYVIFDLGTTQKLNYYTGIVFKGFVRDIGYGILAGGRYDNLVSNFGINRAAVGFAIGIERAMLALVKQHGDGVNLPKKTLIIYSRAKIKDAFLKAEEMRKEGKIVELALNSDSSRYDLQRYSDVVSLL